MMKDLNHLAESSGSFTTPDAFQLMLNNISESFILADENMAVIDSNNAARQGIWNHFGVELNPGFYLLTLAEHSLRPFLKDLYADVLNGKHRKIEHIVDVPNGQNQFFEINVISARNDLNEIKGVIVHAKNVTEKKRSELAIKEAEERWRFALEATSQGVWDWNIKTGEVIYSNAYKIMYGFSEADLKSNFADWEQRIHPEDQAHMNLAINEHSSSEDPYYETTYRLQVNNGSYKWILARGKIVSRDTEGKPLRMIGTHTDLTKTLETKEELKKMNERFFYAAKASSQALWEWDAGSGEAFVSPIFTELFGWKADADRRFEQWHEYIHPDDRSETVSGYYQTLEDLEKNTWSAEYRFLKSDDTYASVSDKAYILRGKNKEVLKVIGAMEDITAKKKTEEELYKTNERFDIMLEATNELLWEWDIPGNSIYQAHEGLKKVYGVADGSSINTIEQWLQRIHPDDRPKLFKRVDELLKASDQQTFEAEYRFKRDDGSYNYVYDRSILLKDEKGQPLRMIGAAQNISKRKELEQELLNNELEYKKLINQATVDSQEHERSEIGRELHDNINQVLTTTKLYLELALSNEDMMKELVKKSSGNISSVIKEIRQLSRSLMDPTIGDLGIIDSIHDLIDNTNLTGKIHISLEIEETIEDFLDRNQKLTIFRILQESLNNILRHAKATFVTIGLTVQEKNIDLVIKDDGIGFSHELAKKGAGLKNITNRVYLINGSFLIESEPGKGCTIKISFPIQKPITHQ